jgi:hypothetical protein
MVAALDATEEKRDCDEFVVKKVMIMSGLNINKFFFPSSCCFEHFELKKKRMNSRTIFPLLVVVVEEEEED